MESFLAKKIVYRKPIAIGKYTHIYVVLFKRHTYLNQEK